MSLFNLFKSKQADVETDPNTASFTQPSATSGLVVASELDRALEECKSTVLRIAAECRAKNRKFRDIEFDLENDREACLHGLRLPPSMDESGLLPPPPESYFAPSDVRRVSQIFEKPQFFIDGASSNDIIQGYGDGCYFLSALATMSTAAGLVEKFCVARDEQVGIYGFIFFKDDHWVPVIIDDLLYTGIPKFEELSDTEKYLYHNDKERFDSSARKGGKALYFAKSGTEGETWVPLIEKAYAKLHGDFWSLNFGYDSEAVEVLTGGVSSYIQTKDILDVDKFWKEELTKANQDRLFGCFFRGLNSARTGHYAPPKVHGLIGGHAYSVLRAVEAKGKRFVVVRNPWGRSEWTGPWSDGSKEWSADSLDILPILGHVFGDDGQFVMEYSDFLECWEQIDRTLLFDSNWITSSQWLRVTARPLPSAWTFGDVCFTVTLPTRSFTILVLSQLDSRYFKDISGLWYWSFDFLLFKRGQPHPIAVSSQPRFNSRSVNLEIELDAGDYVVHVRLDRRSRPGREKGYFEQSAEEWDQRKLSRMLTAREKSRSIASNYKAESQAKHLPIPVEALAGVNFADMEKKAIEKATVLKKEAEAAVLRDNPPVRVVTTTTTTVTTTYAADGTKIATTTSDVTTEPGKPTTHAKEVVASGAGGDADSNSGDESEPAANVEHKPADILNVPRPLPPREFSTSEDSEDDVVFLGLRVYSDKSGGAATIGGQLRHEMEAAFAGLAVKGSK
ncbi:cysteine proteinase [Mycena rebaudengoi]|nr:cysteine proteinase [Mycena rebaudengoi]